MVSCISTVLLILTLSLPWPWHWNSRIRIQSAALQGIASSIDVQLSFTLKSARFLWRIASRIPGRSKWVMSIYLRVLSRQKVHRFSPVGLLSTLQTDTFCCWFKWHRTRSTVRKELCWKQIQRSHEKSKLIGIFKKYFVAIWIYSEINLDFPSMKVQNQECEWAPSSELS